MLNQVTNVRWKIHSLVHWNITYSWRKGSAHQSQEERERDHHIASVSSSFKAPGSTLALPSFLFIYSGSFFFDITRKFLANAWTAKPSTFKLLNSYIPHCPPLLFLSNGNSGRNTNFSVTMHYGHLWYILLWLIRLLASLKQELGFKSSKQNCFHMNTYKYAHWNVLV